MEKERENKKRPIESLDDLKALASREDGCDCFIWFGCARSSKHVTYDPGSDIWGVFNEIDNTFEECGTAELAERTNIPEALAKNALIFEP